MAKTKSSSPDQRLHALSDEDLFAACLWAEARGEPEDGQKAVAGVILNRVSRGMGKNIRAVILKPRQFSWTDPGDTNYGKALQAPIADPGGWKRARRIAGAAMTPGFEDLSRGADHYLNVALTRRLGHGQLPRWAEAGIRDGKVTAEIGHHTFLRLLG